jgi:hypothetical protein
MTSSLAQPEILIVLVLLLGAIAFLRYIRYVRRNAALVAGSVVGMALVP